MRSVTATAAKATSFARSRSACKLALNVAAMAAVVALSGLTARDAARGRMDGLTLEIISAMARKDQVDRALKLWAATDKSQVWAWVPALEITRAETRTGRVTEAEAMRFALIDDLLSGALVPQAMPGLIGGFAQDIAAP